MRLSRPLSRRAAAVGVALTLASGAALPAGGPVAAATTARPLTNLAHLDFLRTTVSPPSQPSHTTYRLAGQPEIGVLWVYADRQADGSYLRVGGGAYDPPTNTWGQGSYDADDVSRAAVVYLRHWRQFGDRHSRDAAYQLLRGLTYLQTATGPNRGNVVLWMQPDGTLNRTPEPADSPNPSDTGPSFWLARTIWALGEGWGAFKTVDPSFAAFLRDRMTLALDAVDRQVLTKYGTYQVVDGLRWPAWLIVDGADATSEAVYGLAAYVKAGGGEHARRDLKKLADGLAAVDLGGKRQWPYGAFLPYAQSRSIWHGYADQMSGSLAAAGSALGNRAYVRAAVGEVARFTPHLLVQGGPDNFWAPAPIDRTQIAYGADATLQNLLSVGAVTSSRGFADVAGVAAAWYFGNNAARAHMYHPATGVTFDGINTNGEVNQNSGAESTIHGLLSMLALDAEPALRRQALEAGRRTQVTWQLVEAESGALAGGATVVTPPDAYTGESQWSGGAYVELGAGARTTVRVTLPARDRYLVMPVFDRQQLPLRSLGTREMVGATVAGTVWQGGAGPQGITPTPGYLDVGVGETARQVGPGMTTVSSVYVGAGRPARLDALLVQPEVEYLVLSGTSGAQALLRSFAAAVQWAPVRVPGSGPATVRSYDATGRLMATATAAGSVITARVEPGGFTYATR